MPRRISKLEFSLSDHVADHACASETFCSRCRLNVQYTLSLHAIRVQWFCRLEPAAFAGCSLLLS